MKYALLFCVCSCLISITSRAQTMLSESDRDQLSPEFNFITLAGQQVTSNDLKGKIIILDFWSSDWYSLQKIHAANGKILSAI